MNVFVERIANLTDWETKSFTLYKNHTEEEIINSTKCSVHFSIVRLTPKLNSIRVSEIKEFHVELCQGKRMKYISIN